MSNGIVILGAGGHAKVIADILISRSENFIGFLDDNVQGTVLGYPVLGKLADACMYQDKCSFIIGIGDNCTRKKIAENFKLRWHTAIHPNAIVARDVKISEGSVVMANAVINPAAKIGKHCIVNTASIIEHDNIIGDYAHISPNATLCGTVNIGALTHIGAGATVKNNISVCENCVIGLGSVVLNSITETGTYVGIPARMIR